MNVRFGLACLSLLISCWCIVTSSVSAASNGVRPRRQSRIATLNEYLTPPAPPNGHTNRGPVQSRNPRNHGIPGGLKPPPPGGLGPLSSSSFRHGKILSQPAAESPSYFSKLMGWLNPFGGGTQQQRPPPPPSPPQQRPDNYFQGGKSNPGYLPPPAHNNGHSLPPWKAPEQTYGPPSSAYGPPTNSFDRYPPAKSLSHSSPPGTPQYFPPGRPINCDPCNHLPWVPLYHGVNTVDSRYAASSADVRIPESVESTFNQQQGHVTTNVYHTPSHEVKTPDFGYGPPQQGTPVLDTNHQASSSSPSHLNSNDNQNFNLQQTEYRSPFTGPIPNPHLYTGAMPPLFKAKPFDSLPQGTDTAFDPPPNLQSKHQNTFGGGSIGSDFVSGNSFDSSQHYNPSSNLGSSFSNQQSFQHGGSLQPPIDNQQHNQQPYQNSGASLQATNENQQPYQNLGSVGSSFQASIDNQQNHQSYQNLGSSFQPSIDNQQNHQSYQNTGTSFQDSINNQQNHQSYQNSGNSFQSSIDNQHNHQLSNSGGSSNEGYVEELPLGAEVVSGPEDTFPPSNFDGNHGNDNGASNSDYQQTLHTSTQHEETSATSSINVGFGQSGQSFNGNSGNGNQANSYGTHVSSDGQHIIHYEQSPIIDLSSIEGDEKRKDSNDSSASSSISASAVEDPPVILQNADGTYGINATWNLGDSSKILWPDDDDLNANTASSTSSSLSNEFTSESGQRVRFEDVHASPSSLDVSVDSTSGQNHENTENFAGYGEQTPRNDSVYRGQGSQGSGNESRTQEHSADSQGSLQAVPENLGNSEQKQNQQTSVYPGLINAGNRGGFGFRYEAPTGSTTDEPFLKALIKSYDNSKNPRQESNQGSIKSSGTDEGRFDPRLLHTGVGFQHSLFENSNEENVRPTNRPQGVKRNKQVQIIIPYTSQYTPKPFHPLPEDWSTKTTPGRTQGRKVNIFETNSEYLAQETRRLEDEATRVLQSLDKPSRSKEVTRSPTGGKTNTSIDVLRLQKNIDNWTIQEYSRGTTASTTVPKSSRPYLSPSKKIPDEYLTTTEPVTSTTDFIENTRKEISDVLAGFSFNDLEHESSASNRIDLSHVEVSSHNEISSVLPDETKSTTATSVTSSTTERDSWGRLPVSISPLNKERVYVVTPQTVSTVPTNRKRTEDKLSKNKNSTNEKKKSEFSQFETIERAYQVLPQAVNNLAVASTGPATIPLWGIMEHEIYAVSSNQTTTPKSPILYSGHSKVSHTRQ